VLLVKENITLTGPNIRNNYLRIRQLENLLGPEVKTSQDEIVLELESVGPVTTGLDSEKGILAEREAIRRFFEIHELKPGDKIEVEKVSNNHLKISPVLGIKTANSVAHMGHDEQLIDHAQKIDALPLFNSNAKKQSSLRVTSARSQNRANDLNGKEWTSYSVSVWKKTGKIIVERPLEHTPTSIVTIKQVILFPAQLSDFSG
jgi:hypothetical protein